MAKSSPAKSSQKAPAKKAATKKASAKKAPAKKAATKKAATKKAATKKAPAKKAATKKAPAKKAATKKAEEKVEAAEAPAVPAPEKPAPVVVASRVTRSPEVSTAEEPPFEPEFLDAQRAELVSERATYFRQSEVLQAEADSLTENREPGDTQFDEESGEGDSFAVERERDLALSQQALAAVEQIDAALERLDAGTYGICRVSGLRIPRARLEAIPWATERVEHKVGGFGRR